MPARGRKLGGAVRRHDDIIWFAPEAKLGATRGPLLRQKPFGARAVADMGGNPRESPRQHLVRDRAPRVGAADIGERERAAVTVGGRAVVTKLAASAARTASAALAFGPD